MEVLDADDGALVDEGLLILDERECRRLLATVTIGRVGVTIGALPAIFPVNYRFVGGDIYFRTGEGTKLRAAVDNAVVAFEVDNVDPTDRTGWSVQVIGIAERVSDDDLCGDTIEPWAPGSRQHLVRIRAEILTGRRIVH